MKFTLLKVVGISAVAAGLALSQAPQGQTSQGSDQARSHHHMLGRFAANLNLTDAQKQQAQQIFSQARQAAEPVRAQLKQNREALSAAIKSNSTAEIDRLSNANGPLLAQVSAIHAKAFAQFYSILTQEQKDKVGTRFQGMMNGMGHMRGRPADKTVN